MLCVLSDGISWLMGESERGHDLKLVYNYLVRSNLRCQAALHLECCCS